MSNTRKPRRPAAFDFDKIRAKKTRVTGDLPPVKIGGKSYTLKPSMPLAVTDYFAENSKPSEDGGAKVMIEDMKMLLAKLFGEDQWNEIREVIDITEVPDLFSHVFRLYNESVGESSASGAS